MYTFVLIIDPIIFVAIFNEKWVLNKYFPNKKLPHFIWFYLFYFLRNLMDTNQMFVPLRDICQKVLLRCTRTCCALLPEEDAKNVVCVWHCLLCGQEWSSASWLERTGPLSDHSCLCTVNVFPCSRGSQPGLIATEPSVIQECNYLLTQIIYLAGSSYPSHRAASTCQ